MKEGAVKGESERVTPGDIFAGLQHVTQKGSDKKTERTARGILLPRHWIAETDSRLSHLPGYSIESFPVPLLLFGYSFFFLSCKWTAHAPN
jgi:hypothetical protein